MGIELLTEQLKEKIAGVMGYWERVLITDSQRMERLVKWKHAAVMTSKWRLVSPTVNGDTSKLELYEIRRDAGQQRNVAASFPDVVKEFRQRYEEWWKEASQRADEVVRIVLGHAAAKTVKLSSHDWHGQGAESAWNQRQIREAPAANGAWAVEVAQDGHYNIELRRWPRELDLPINAPYRDASPNREKTPGRGINVKSARLAVGNVDERKEAKDGEKTVVFRVALKAGPTELQTWFYDEDGSERGAYYVYVERVG